MMSLRYTLGQRELSRCLLSVVFDNRTVLIIICNRIEIRELEFGALQQQGLRSPRPDGSGTLLKAHPTFWGRVLRLMGEQCR